MFGWCSVAASRASLRNMFTKLGLFAYCGRIRLTHTSFSKPSIPTVRVRYSSAIPPTAIWRITSYFPSLSPGARERRLDGAGVTTKTRTRACPANDRRNPLPVQYNETHGQIARGGRRRRAGNRLQLRRERVPLQRRSVLRRGRRVRVFQRVLQLPGQRLRIRPPLRRARGRPVEQVRRGGARRRRSD